MKFDTNLDLTKRLTAIGSMIDKDNFVKKIDTFSTKILNALKNNNKIIFCGNGGSFAQASHMSAELSGKYLKNRDGQKSLVLGANPSSLSSIGNDYSYKEIFSRELDGIGDKGDLLISYSTSGNSENIT